MRILITGASGCIGWRLANRLLRRPEDNILMVRRHSPTPPQGQAIDLDLTQSDAVREAIASFQPDVVFHCAALSQTGECETRPDLAWRVNVGATEALVNGLAHTGAGAHLVFLSTDMVFDGRHAPYAEDAAPSPGMVYGQTKQAAEDAVRRYAGPWTIVRSALCFGPPSQSYHSFLQWLARGLQDEAGVTLFTDEYRTAVYVEDLCDLLELAAQRRAIGLYHAGGPERLSRAEFGRIFAQVFGLDPGRVMARKATETPLTTYRPPDLSMDIARARRDLDYAPRAAREALTDLASRLDGVNAL